MRIIIESLFPNLRPMGYEITSPESRAYNCIAWVVGINDECWEPDPDYFWPNGVPRTNELDSWILVFRNMGYGLCEHSDPEVGYEKIAIFVDQYGEPTHAAKQLPTGEWTSKLGPYEDISYTLDGLIGDKYGEVAAVLRRRI